MAKEIADGMLGEYDRGFGDAFRAIIAGLEASIENADAIPEAKPMLDGLRTSLHVVKGLRDEFDKIRLTVENAQD